MKTKTWLVVIFLLTLTIRLLLAFSISNFTYESYFHLRQVEQIKETSLPSFEDELSYGGRTIRFLPFFHYLMALFALFIPLEITAKIIPNILMASLTILIYLISYRLTANRTASLLSALIVGFMPILYFTNSFSVETLFLPLIFLAIYLFLNIQQKKQPYLYVITFLLLSLTSSLTIILLLGFLVYVILSFLETKPLARSELELMFFSLIFYLWLQFLFFKDVLINEGIGFVWQNIPQPIIQQYFQSFSILEAIILVSAIPFLTGIFIVYRSLFKSKNESGFLLISLVISVLILSWSRLIQFRLSLAFLGIVLSILFSSFYITLYLFISKTKFSYLKKNLALTTIIILLASMIFSTMSVAFNQEVPSDQEITAFKWIRENLSDNSKIAALLEEGHLITYYGKKMNVMDDQFHLIDNIEQRFIDLNSIFTTPLQTYAVSLFDQYGITHIMLTERAKQKLAISNFKYLTVECYERVYDEEEVKIYQAKCGLVEEPKLKEETI